MIPRVRTNKDGFKRTRTMAEALKITNGDLAGPVLIEFGVLHRRHESRIFASQGAEGASGRWPDLSPHYRRWKRRVFPGRKILVLSGEMKERFTKPSRPEYVQEFVPKGDARGVFRFGARDEIATLHFRGIGVPVRDMVSKTATQVAQFKASLNVWYQKRVRQVLRHFGPQIRASRPR